MYNKALVCAPNFRLIIILAFRYQLHIFYMLSYIFPIYIVKGSCTELTEPGSNNEHILVCAHNFQFRFLSKIKYDAYKIKTT